MLPEVCMYIPVRNFSYTAAPNIGKNSHLSLYDCLSVGPVIVIYVNVLETIDFRQFRMLCLRVANIPKVSRPYVFNFDGGVTISNEKPEKCPHFRTRSM